MSFSTVIVQRAFVVEHLVASIAREHDDTRVRDFVLFGFFGLNFVVKRFLRRLRQAFRRVRRYSVQQRKTNKNERKRVRTSVVVLTDAKRWPPHSSTPTLTVNESGRTALSAAGGSRTGIYNETYITSHVRHTLVVDVALGNSVVLNIGW